VPHVTLPDSIDTLIVGAGQAGLTLSALLADDRREHLLVERRESLGGGWQDRWDSFRLVTPNWAASFPGWAYDAPDADEFMPRDAIAARVRGYADVIGAPVVAGTTVERVGPRRDGRFDVRTSHGRLVARTVVAATGSFHVPRIPPVARRITPRVTQLHSHHYRNEAALPPGAVLLIGTGQTGVQLAEELHDAGRPVFLSVGTAGRVPRRYRGRDLFRWLAAVAVEGPKHGLGLPTVDELPDPRLRFAGNPHVSGHKGGHDTNLRQMARDGMTLIGRVVDADGERLVLGNDLAANLANADSFFDRMFRPRIDGLIDVLGIDAPPDDRIAVDFEPATRESLDLADAGIGTIIWTAGYGLDYGWIDAPIFDDRGYPRHRRGVTDIPGLCFLGLLWQTNLASSTLFGVLPDARHVAAAIAERR
jgi:putative flavoprotein involved in K+ transport